MADNRLNGIAAAQSSPLSSGDAPLLPGDEDLRVAGVLVPLVTPIHIGFLRGLVTQNADLFQLFTQGMTVIRITGETAGTDHKGFFDRGGKAGFDAKLVAFVDFAFADALDL